MFRSLSLLGIVFGVMAALAFWGDPAPSQGLQTVTVGIDVETEGNGATALGEIQQCRSVANAPGQQFSIDVFLDEVPSGQDIAGFNYLLSFDDSRFMIAAQDHQLLLASAGGSQAFDSLGEEAPDTTAPHLVAAADFGAAEPGPVKGVLGRYTVEVLPAAPDGVGSFSLSNVAVAGKETASEVNVTEVLDASIALGVDCSAAEPPPPQPTATPEPPAPDAGGTPGPDQPPEAQETAATGDDTQGTPPTGVETEGTATGPITADGSPSTGDGQLSRQEQEDIATTAVLASLASGLNLTAARSTVTVNGLTVLAAAFADENDNPLPEEDITFKIEKQPGTDANLEGQAELTKKTDAENGVAIATLNVGGKTGTIEISATAQSQIETIKVEVVAAGAEDGGGGPWAYIGGGIGGGIALALAVAGAFWWRRRRAGGTS